MKTILIAAFYCFVSGLAVGQQTQNKLGELFNELYERNMINGNVLVAVRGGIIYQRSFGLQNTETAVLNNKATNFELASLSKVITAVAVMQLAERRLVELNEPVKKYLPDFPYPAITVRHLLSHTSGLPDFELFDAAINEEPNRVMTNADIIPALKKWGPLKLSPGQQWSYSSPGIGLLALIIEKVTNLKFQEYLTRNIFKKAAMTASYSVLNRNYQHDPHKAVPYALPFYFSNDFVLADTMARNVKFLHQSGGVEGPGLLVSNVTDLYRFDEALFGGRLLKPSTLKIMFKPQRLADGSLATAPHAPGKALFGLGWFILPDSSAGKIVFHSGYKPGTTTILMHNITKRQCIIVLDNGSSPGVHASAMNAMQLINGKPAGNVKTAVTFPYGKTLLTSGPDAALVHMQTLVSDTLHYTMAARDWIAMGYEFYRTEHQKEALETFRMGFILYPDNDFLCMLYADALVKSDKRKEAKMLYLRAQKLNPKNPEIVSRLEKLRDGH
ncbi:serine hydrolase [Arcticibacter tournemirensis]|uniref:Beta-lactamase-related domain-containing protein n=1 Tax=Arcticibacter tournemirensis TaxID=699437 RepID=A0A4Q0M6X8_9SPHI|nr:serine hydrolase [Arcticibacter tournemirensis]RXF68831.1 hypothetical protein EKH83_14010 [Arcticibacter tournemirensis]